MATKSDSRSAARPSVGLQMALALLRMGVGWLFLYEGLAKFFDPKWSAAGYLENATGPLAGFYGELAANAQVLEIVNQLNIWGLILVGACLLVGMATRFSALCGIVLLLLYYGASPRLFSGLPDPGGGHYLFVDWRIVLGCALMVTVIYPASSFGLDGFLRLPRKGKQGEAGAPRSFGRREVLTRLIGLPVVGAFTLAVLKQRGYFSHEEEQLADRLNETGAKPDATSGATIKRFEWTTIDKLDGQLPKAKIGDLALSRMILGGNLIGGWAHARDLIYAAKLVKAYHHEAKIFETLDLAEKCGVNTIITNPQLCEIITKYWEVAGGNIQFISDCGGKDVVEMVKKSVDNGACSCYIQGGIADNLVAEQDFDTIERALELIRRNKMPCGIGAHRLETIKACVERGFKPDYWMKTLHKTNYWSAQAETEKDNIWCREPEETIEFMKDIEEPWIAFKTLAAGAIKPEIGFKYALEGGADFLCVGMYDFQLVDDVNIALETLAGDLKRERPWRAETIA